MDAAWITYGVPIGAIAMALTGFVSVFLMSKSFDRRYPFTEAEYRGVKAASGHEINKGVLPRDPAADDGGLG